MKIAEKLIPDSMDPNPRDGRLPYIQVLEVLSKSEIIALAREGLKLREPIQEQRLAGKFGMKSYVELEQMISALTAELDSLRADKTRYEWLKDEPQGAQHLLNLLLQGKGTKASFDTMIDRIMKSKSNSDSARKDKSE